VVVNGRLYLRDQEFVYCFNVKGYAGSCFLNPDPEVTRECNRRATQMDADSEGQNGDFEADQAGEGFGSASSDSFSLVSAFICVHQRLQRPFSVLTGRKHFEE
jgi:hypothetical protein